MAGDWCRLDRASGRRASLRRHLPAAALSGAVLALSLTLPHPSAGPVICAFRRITGWPCLTCGMTRSWVAAGHGDWAGAVAESPLGAVLYVAAWAFFLWHAVPLLAGWTLVPGPRLRPAGRVGWWLLVVVFVALLANWAWRMAHGRV